MRISKVYTRSGDAGETSLASGARVSKSSLRVCACGDVDELNSFIGLVRCHLAQPPVAELLEQVQNHLFVLGADLATPADGNTPPIRRIASQEVSSLENAIDQHNASLPPLQEFILPAGNESGSLLHIARAVARRAERTLVVLAQAEPVNPLALAYLNRLSDLLFVLARLANRQGGSSEVFARFH
jgi:cob(I)alamin adenosyltransferase